MDDGVSPGQCSGVDRSEGRVPPRFSRPFGPPDEGDGLVTAGTQRGEKGLTDQTGRSGDDDAHGPAPIRC